jgi:signal transduction histidine kinase
MASLSTRPESAERAEVTVRPFTRLGQVFLDVRRRHLSFLDPVARQLHEEGVPFSPADLAGRPLLSPAGEAVTAADLPLIVSWREGRPVEAIFFFTPPQGLRQQLVWNTSPVRDSQGEITGVVGTVRCGPPEPDWQAMAGLAHDLRTPLNAITLQLAVLEHLTAANPQLSKVLDGIRSSADRALQVGQDLLSWCRGPGQQGRSVEKDWFALEPLLADLGREQGLAARGKGLLLATDFSASRGWEVATDRTRLARILSNLLVNAVRYTSRGRVEFTTSWREEPEGSSRPPDGTHARVLAIGIVDTGVGITAEEQDSIFQPFERGRAGKEGDSGGSGMGLAVVDRLVEELGLDLEVYSEYGRGSAFHLLLPAEMLRPGSAEPG